MKFVTRNTRRQASRLAFLGSAAAFALLAPGVAFAQDAGGDDEVEPAESPDDRQIVVTGSRITREFQDGLLPTKVLTDEFIEERGFFNLGEAIIDQPIFSSQSNTDTDFNQSTADIGFTFIDLFGLGSERTLTLVDGRRVVSSSAPQPNRSSGVAGLQVDLNTIPTALIDRVETVTIGGAPIYGADAVAGAVNVVLKRDFEGIEADAQVGLSGSEDAGNFRLRATIGKNFLDDRLNLVLAGEYSRRDGLAQTARAGANDIQVSNPLLATDPVTFFTTQPPLPLNTFQVDTAFPGVSAFGTPASPLISGSFGTGAVLGDNPLGFAENAASEVLMFNAEGELVPVPIGDGNGTFLFTQNQPDFPGLYRGQDFVTLLNESERFIVSSLGSFEFSPDFSFFYRANFSKLEASSVVEAPATLGTPVLPGLSVSINNPFLSQNSRAQLQAAQTDAGIALPFLFTGPNFTLGKSLTEFDNSGIDAESETFSIIAGFEGGFALGERNFKWDLSYSYGETNSLNSAPQVIADAFALATDVVLVDGSGAILTDAALFDPVASFSFNEAAGGYASPSGQQILCRSRATGAAGGQACLPFNPFGAQNPDAVIASLQGLSVLDTRIEQQFLQGNVTGSPFDLPAGPLGVALGFEYREEQARFSADANTLAGNFVGSSVGSSGVAGGFNSTEFYAEAVVPLISGEMLGTNFLDRIEAEGAFRLIDNSAAGTDEVWTAGGRVVFEPGFTFRGNFTRSVRSPGIGQLFSGAAPSFSGVADPCANANLLGGNFPDNREANCIAAVQAAGLAGSDADALTFLQSFTGAIGGVPGVVGGNPALENEIADSWTVGLVASPSFLPGLVFTVDWNDIEINGAISSLGGSQVLASCFDSPAFPGIGVCDQFTRDPDTFNLTSFQAGFTNIGFINFAALTANLRYGFDLGGAGRLDLQGSLFYLDEFETSQDGLVSVDQVDTVGYEEYRVQASAAYSIGGLKVIWETNYAPGAFITAAERDGTANTFEFDQTKDRWIHDLSLIYDVNDDVSLRFIANNITDDQQPIQLRQFATVQSRLGRTFFFGVNTRW